MGDSKDPSRNSRFTDGRIGWRKIEIRSQDTLSRWDFDDDGGIQGMWQQPPPDYRERHIPIEKALLFRTKTSKGNPEGYSILRNAFTSWYKLKRIQELEAIGIERDLAGLPVIEVPPEITLESADADQKAQYEAAKTLVSEIRRDEREGLVVPAEEISDEDGRTLKTGFKVRLLSSAGQRQIDTDKIVRRYESRIAMSVLAEFLLLGMDKVGSFALASSKTNMFAVAIGAWLKSIAAVFNRFAIPRLFMLNGMAVRELPYLIPGDIETPPLDEIASFIANLTKVGVIIPDQSLQRKVRQLANLPEPEEE